MRSMTLQNLRSHILSAGIVWSARFCVLTALLAINVSAQILSLTADNTTSTGTTLRWVAPAELFPNCVFYGFSILQDGKEIASLADLVDRDYVVQGLSPSTKYEFTVAEDIRPLPSSNSYGLCRSWDLSTTVTTLQAKNSSARTFQPAPGTRPVAPPIGWFSSEKQSATEKKPGQETFEAGLRSPSQVGFGPLGGRIPPVECGIAGGESEDGRRA